MIGSPEPQGAAAASPDERGLGLVQVESLPPQQADGQQPLVHVRQLAAEAHEGPRTDHAGDLALEAALPARLEQLAAQQERRTNPVGVPLDRRRLALALGAAPAGLAHRRGLGLVLSRPERGQERPVGDEIRVAPDRRGEVGVRGAAEPGVADVAL